MVFDMQNNKTRLLDISEFDILNNSSAVFTDDQYCLIISPYISLVSSGSGRLSLANGINNNNPLYFERVTHLVKKIIFHEALFLFTYLQG